MIPDFNQISSFWEHNQLKRWPKEPLKACGLSNDVVVYLSSVGLPCPNDWPWEIDSRVDSLPCVDTDGTLLAITYDGVVPICIDRSKSERVVAVESMETSRFVNSTVMQFGACLYHFRSRAYYRSADTDSDREAAEKLYLDIIETDPIAVAEPNLYWTGILSQVFEGRL